MGEEHMVVNTAKLIAEIKARGLTLGEVSGRLQMSYCTFYRKIKTKGKGFTIGEMHLLTGILGLTQQAAADIFLHCPKT